MIAVVGLLHFHRHHLGIELGGGQPAVAEQLLDVADIRSILQQMGGAASPEGMGGDGLFDSGSDPVGPDGLANGSGLQGLAVVCKKEFSFLGIFCGISGSDLLQIFLEIDGGVPAQGYQSLFSPFSLADKQGLLAQVRIMNGEAEQFIEPDTGGVEDFHDGPVADMHGQGEIGLLQQFLHLLNRQHRLDFAVLPAGFHQPFRGVDQQPVVFQKIFKEPFYRPQLQGLGLAAVFLAHDLFFIVLDDLAVHLAQVGDGACREICAKFSQTLAIKIDRGVGIAHGLQPGTELPDGGFHVHRYHSSRGGSWPFWLGWGRKSWRCVLQQTSNRLSL